MSNPAISIFFSYSHLDESLRDELAKHLKLLERQGAIATWHDRKITAGQEWANAIDHHLETAQIILLLVSVNFLASDYCYDLEMKRALERHETGAAKVIPIILKPVDWEFAPFGSCKHCRKMVNRLRNGKIKMRHLQVLRNHCGVLLRKCSDRTWFSLLQLRLLL